LNKQIFVVERESDTIHSDNIETCNIISECEERKMQIMDLNKVAQLLTLKMGCWHMYLEHAYNFLFLQGPIVTKNRQTPHAKNKIN
jgi:hypothetical protein